MLAAVYILECRRLRRRPTRDWSTRTSQDRKMLEHAPGGFLCRSLLCMSMPSGPPMVNTRSARSAASAPSRNACWVKNSAGVWWPRGPMASSSTTIPLFPHGLVQLTLYLEEAVGLGGLVRKIGRESPWNVSAASHFCCGSKLPAGLRFSFVGLSASARSKKNLNPKPWKPWTINPWALTPKPQTPEP